MKDDDFSILDDCIKKLKLKYLNVNTSGQCFELSFEACVLLHESSIHTKLVHANLNINNEMLGHAWLEYKNIVIDLTQAQEHWINYLDEYYEEAQIKQSVKYSGVDIQNLISSYGNMVVWEPWIIFKD